MTRLEAAVGNAGRQCSATKLHPMPCHVMSCRVVSCHDIRSQLLRYMATGGQGKLSCLWKYTGSRLRLDNGFRNRGRA